MSKQFCLLGILISLLVCSPQKKTRVIFFGDSITELGVKPKGYITLIDSLAKLKSNGEFEFIGSGVSGDKITDLYFRLDKDVLNRDPQVVVIFIGINDIWHKRLLGTGTDPDKFEKFYQAIIDKLKARSIQIILCTPPVIGEKLDNGNEQDVDLNRYSHIIQGIAKKNNLRLADLRRIFLEFNSKNNPENKDRGILTTDRVHLNATGNQLVAAELWRLINNN